ncbi:MAG: hypothetical protein NTX50_01150 [Candidatus Sumerlaeota bacterium]|nr:hypothetical protein [Candidatus Sumerlaeota bacterium]
MKAITRYLSIALIAVILMGSTGCFFGRGGHDRNEHRDGHDERRDHR